MGSIAELLAQHHLRCDREFESAQEAFDRGDLRGAQAPFEAFGRDLALHLAGEEQLLFPAFEEATGQSGGPTAVMRTEHEMMRELLGEIGEALAAGDAASCRAGAGTLLALLGQHNHKEEHILYPMCDRALGARRAALLEALRAQLELR